MKIICTATSFGYGPISKLLTICKELKNTDCELLLVGNGICIELASHTEYFKEIINFDFNKADQLSELEYIKGADLWLDVLEPLACPIANKLNIPFIYVDSLFWMWDKIHPMLKDVSHYIAQDFPGVREKVKDFQQEIHKNVEKFHISTPIVDKSFLKDQQSNSDLLMINFSGIETPLSKPNEIMNYPDSLFQMLVKALNNSRYDEIIVTGNKKVMNQLDNKYGPIFRGEFKHLSHDEFLKTLNRSKMIITSPGLTLTYEAMAYKVPIRFLPAQNYSQALMLKRHRSSGFTDISFDWSDIYSHYQIKKDLPEEEGVELVSRIVNEFYGDIKEGKFKKISLLEDMVNITPPEVSKQTINIGDYRDALKIIQDILMKKKEAIVSNLA
ncbi:hypothetical protein [Priestia megaterium]|uniref:hypothetical protein n=1 Tax=Priestia megaterium TaxID=1404 RepID=UPI0018A0F263|nr:hypothetical protein [Priestia megaterium]